IGYGVEGLTSIEWASVKPTTLRANSTAASCIPKQTPKKGVCSSRAYWIASILPSIPLVPKPPGTTIPSTSDNSLCIDSLSDVSELIQRIDISASKENPACFNDSMRDKYASGSSTYFPTKPISTV